MRAFRPRRLAPEANGQYDVVLGICPGCDLWQVDYTDVVAASYMRAHYGADGEVVVDPQPWADVIEALLEEHVAECHGLRELLD